MVFKIKIPWLSHVKGLKKNFNVKPIKEELWD